MAKRSSSKKRVKRRTGKKHHHKKAKRGSRKEFRSATERKLARGKIRVKTKNGHKWVSKKKREMGMKRYKKNYSLQNWVQAKANIQATTDVALVGKKIKSDPLTAWYNKIRAEYDRLQSGTA